MGCAQSSSATAIGPKVHPEVLNTAATPSSEEMRGAVAASPADNTTAETVINSPPKSDMVVAAQAQQEELLREKSDQERQKRVALFRATKDGDIDSVRYALASGANVNSVGMWDNTPLICACQYGFAEIAGILMDDTSCDVNVMNEKGCTALHHAAIEGLSEIVVRLLENGANPSVKPAKLYNEKIDRNEVLDPLQAATAVGDVDSVKALASALSTSVKDVSTKTAASNTTTNTTTTTEEQALKLAISRGITKAIQPILELYAKRQSMTLDGVAMLIQACDSKNEMMTVTLLEALQTLKFLDSEQICKETSLVTKACEHDMAQVLKVLLDMGATVDEETLAVAQQSNNPEIMALLPANPQ